MAGFADVPWLQEHIKLYQTDPEKAHIWDSTVVGGPGPLTTLLLTTIGRKTGNPRPIPLIYREIDGKHVIIASRGGTPTHPVWYENLVVNSECEVRVATKDYKARARTLEKGEERDRYWALMAEYYPPYNQYQANTTRRLPVVVLDPIEG